MPEPSPDSSLKGLFTPPFVVAVVLLAISAVLAGPFARLMDFKRGKLSLPLKAPLYTLDAAKLEPYHLATDVDGAELRQVLSPEIVDALGTESYISWHLEDTSLPRGHPLRLAILFVTYYSGGRDLVPHTPDVCFLGSGYEPAQRHENLTAELQPPGREKSEVPIRVCTFVRTAVFQRRRQTVVYTFHCNGRYAVTRTGVRLLINDPRNVYAYFSKVEVRFPGATRAQSIEGAAKLFSRVLPVLEEDHWPDFEKAEAEARESPNGA